MADETGEVTRLLGELGRGRSEAAAELAPLIYDELRRIARRSMQLEPADHILQPTALVNEAFMRLLGQRETDWRNRAHFFAVAAQLMRRILLDYARRRHAVKRGSAGRRITLHDGLLISESRIEDVLALDEALSRLAQLDQQQSRLVELRFFAGLNVEEISHVMGISPTTVKREWSSAKAWLQREMGASR
jgi:RNA polymerase sigma factor (TIGR02999 family)